jgi:GNAT superfamily N-acetyltransferase
VPARADAVIRPADAGDAHVIGQLLHDFNAEFDEPTPSAEANAARIAELLAVGDTEVVLGHADGDPAGLAVLRFRPALWSTSLECYLAELYVAPDRRGRGLGRALMEAAIELARVVLERPDHVDGCEECTKTGDHWLHLRVCRTCGKVGCCDSSPNRHASKHAAADGHPIMTSVEPGEHWSWRVVDEFAFQLQDD